MIIEIEISWKSYKSQKPSRIATLLGFAHLTLLQISLSFLRNINMSSTILLDTNAGIKPTNEILEEYTRLSLLTNNVYGFTDAQM